MTPRKFDTTYLKYQNVIYRILHESLPTAQTIHRICLSFLPNNHCNICQHPTETTNHFLIWCLPKRQVWFIVWEHLFHTKPSLFFLLKIITQCKKAKCFHFQRRSHWLSVHMSFFISGKPIGQPSFRTDHSYPNE